MAGGKGTRLAALTKDEIPKPMVPVAGKPLLLWQVERLKENGITDLIMVIGHLGNKIKEYFGDGEQFGVSIRYFEETDDETIGQTLGCDTSTVWRNRKRLVQRIAIMLYGARAVR